MAGYRVSDGTQVNIDGRIYPGGEVLDGVPQDVVALLARGVVVEVQDKANARKKYGAGGAGGQN